MRRFVISTGFLLAAFALPAVAGPVPDDVGRDIADGFARPKAAAFASAAEGMRREMAALCAAPDAAALARAREGFAGLVAAWGGVSVLRFGPLPAENRFERVFFWPDARGVIVRQVQVLLAEQDESVLDAAALAGKSVAVQGLPALEYVLHGTGAEALATFKSLGEGGHRCRYGLAIAGNVEDIARAVQSEWAAGAAFHDTFAMPAPEHELYRSPREVAAEAVKAMATAVQFVRNAELLPALGDSADKARGRRAPLWRSDLTFALAMAQIDAVAALADASGFAADEAVRRPVETLRLDLVNASAALGKIEAPAETAFAEPADRDRIRYVTVALDTANKTLGGALSAALGLTMGFNALDGD